MTNAEIASISYEDCPIKCVGCESMCDAVTIKQCRENLSARMDRWEGVTFDEKYVGSECKTLYFIAPKEMLSDFGFNYPDAVSTEVSLEYSNTNDIVASISPTNTEGEDYDWNPIELSEGEIKVLLNLAGEGRWKSTQFDEKTNNGAHTSLYFTAPKAWLDEYSVACPGAVQAIICLEFVIGTNYFEATLSPVDETGEEIGIPIPINLSEGDKKKFLRIAANGLKEKSIKSISDAYAVMDDFPARLGDTLLLALAERKGDSGLELANSIIRIFERCRTQKEYDVANLILQSVFGYNIEALVDKSLGETKRGSLLENYNEEELWEILE